MLYRLRHWSVWLFILLLLSACTSSNKEESQLKGNETNQLLTTTTIPDKITLLFVTQDFCPSCRELETIMSHPKPKELLERYFDIQEVDFNEALPSNLTPPFDTPTVYFLGNGEVLIEPMIGEKSETELMEYLTDALREFKIIYGVDLQNREEKN